jgi:hypothetical protein
LLVTERDRIVAALADTGVLQGIRWAFESAARRARDDYDEPTGHNATWAGMNRWVLLCDRLDRVFSCGRYATPADSPEAVGLDVLFATLTPAERDSFPRIEPGTVVRDDVKGSPGWRLGDVRWLLASADFGGVDEIDWARRSRVKQATAKQLDPDSSQLSILDVLADDLAAAAMRAALEEAADLDIMTLVVTHTHDIDSDDRELFLGLPSMDDKGVPWAWKENLLRTPPSDGGRAKPPVTKPDPSDVPDAPVRLRQPGDKAAPKSSDAPSSGSAPARTAQGR